MPGGMTGLSAGFATAGRCGAGCFPGGTRRVSAMLSDFFAVWANVSGLVSIGIGLLLATNLAKRTCRRLVTHIWPRGHIEADRQTTCPSPLDPRAEREFQTPLRCHR